MIIPKKTLQTWKNLKQRGDIALLATEIGKAEPTIYNIFATGECHVRDAQIINAFFKKRKKEIEDIKIEDHSE